MDGYAVRAADLADASDDAPTRLPVTADIPAGRVDRLTLEPGAAHRIMTGAPMPDGVLMPSSRSSTPTAPPTSSRSAAPWTSAPSVRRRAGSDITTGDLALTDGTVLGAPQIGLLAALGIAEVTVPARPHVVVLSTGSGIVACHNRCSTGRSTSRTVRCSVPR